MKKSMIIVGIYTTKTAVKLKPEKYSGLNGIQTYDLCDTVVVLYQLSYQVNWELVTLTMTVFFFLKVKKICFSKSRSGSMKCFQLYVLSRV